MSWSCLWLLAYCILCLKATVIKIYLVIPLGLCWILIPCRLDLSRGKIWPFFTSMQLRKPILCCSMQILEWICLKIACHPSYTFSWFLNVLHSFLLVEWMTILYQLSCNCYILSPIFRIYSVCFLHVSILLSMSCLKSLGHVRVLVIYCVINFEHLKKHGKSNLQVSSVAMYETS